MNYSASPALPIIYGSLVFISSVVGPSRSTVGSSPRSNCAPRTPPNCPLILRADCKLAVAPRRASHHASGAIDFCLTAWLDGWRSMAGRHAGSGASFTPTPPDDAGNLVKWRCGGSSSEVVGMTAWGHYIVECCHSISSCSVRYWQQLKQFIRPRPTREKVGT